MKEDNLGGTRNKNVKKRNPYLDLARKPEGKTPLGVFELR
jgi:hypothetical protein